MRNYMYLLAIIISTIGCEDVIEVELASAPPRLTVDAVIRLDTNQPLTTATINIAESSSFFERIQPVQVEELRIQNLDYEPIDTFDQNFIIFNETGSGNYQATARTDFFTSGELTLTIRYNNESFVARTRFAPSVPFDSIVQGDAVLFSGDETEIVVSFTDIADQANFYIFDFGFNEYLVSEDEFYPGQRFEFSYFYDNVESGTSLDISILGADESFYTYMEQLIVQSGGNQGPFQTPVATVRGNIINITDTQNVDEVDNFALGYFAVVEEFKERITVE